jgi:hypothetical protein
MSECSARLKLCGMMMSVIIVIVLSSWEKSWKGEVTVGMYVTLHLFELFSQLSPSQTLKECKF